MKRLALILATAALAAAFTAGAEAQQQTFWQAKAAPKLPPTQAPTTVNDAYFGALPCQGSIRGNGRNRTSSHMTPRTNGHGSNPTNCNDTRRPSPRPSSRPAPRPSFHPLARHT